MVIIYYGLLKVLVENSDAEQVYRTPTPGLTDFTIKSSTPIRGVDSWDNVGKLFDKKRKSEKRMATPSSKDGLYSSYNSTDRDGGGD